MKVFVAVFVLLGSQFSDVSADPFDCSDCVPKSEFTSEYTFQLSKFADGNDGPCFPEKFWTRVSISTSLFFSNEQPHVGFLGPTSVLLQQKRLELKVLFWNCTIVQIGRIRQ